jgi:predicted DNA-binding transcriptional regulator AlpA
VAGLLSIAETAALLKVKLLNPKEVSGLTGVPTTTLAQWRYRKIGIPYLRIGRLVRYDLADVDAYLQRCRVEVRGQHTDKRGEHVHVP